MSLPKLTLVLGGAASGKSAFAEKLVIGTNAPRVYIATAQAYDTEMKEKITKHRQMRGPDWHTIEEPIAVVDRLMQLTQDQVVLLDCATLWLSNILLSDRDISSEVTGLMDALQRCSARVIVVSNEVGQGIVPDNALSRQFRNAQGALNQQIAAKAQLVIAVMAGLPLAFKGTLP